MRRRTHNRQQHPKHNQHRGNKNDKLASVLTTVVGGCFAVVPGVVGVGGPGGGEVGVVLVGEGTARPF